MGHPERRRIIGSRGRSRPRLIEFRALPRSGRRGLPHCDTAAPVARVGIWNSGLIQPDEKIFGGLHSPVIIVTGGESDVAYANGKRDFDTMPAKIPVFDGIYPSVGHGGTYNEDNGGPFGVAAVAWLKWQLMNDTGATGKGYFVGATCGICADAKWQKPTGARACTRNSAVGNR